MAMASRRVLPAASRSASPAAKATEDDPRATGFAAGFGNEAWRWGFGTALGAAAGFGRTAAGGGAISGFFGGAALATFFRLGAAFDAAGLAGVGVNARAGLAGFLAGGSALRAMTLGRDGGF